jgi:RHS repeat-associated protein
MPALAINESTTLTASRLYYYGARYYDPKASVWLGVDPMADKYPGLSSYAYCANNPIRFIDPNGMEFDEESKPIAMKAAQKAENLAARLEKRAGRTSNEEKKADLTARASELRQSAGEIREMDANKDYTFHIETGDENKTAPTTDKSILISSMTEALVHFCMKVSMGIRQ